MESSLFRSLCPVTNANLTLPPRSLRFEHPGYFHFHCLTSLSGGGNCDIKIEIILPLNVKLNMMKPAEVFVADRFTEMSQTIVNLMALVLLTGGFGTTLCACNIPTYKF